MHPSTAAKTILICEDEEPLRELMRAAIGDGYVFLEAADGRDALALVAERRPDVVVLDLMLPGMSGLDVLRELRADAATATTPVVVVTAWSEARDDVVAAGADRFVCKPFDPDELKAVVDELADA